MPFSLGFNRSSFRVKIEIPELAQADVAGATTIDTELCNLEIPLAVDATSHFSGRTGFQVEDSAL